MMQIRRSSERGHAHHGWLESFHSFSFANYYDPEFMGFRNLRVINEDFIAGGGGFPTHGHRDMEIVTYIISGALDHRDTLGTAATIRPGEMQRMTAGTGIQHSEFNHSETENVHLLQIWILPQAGGLKPGYEQKDFSKKLQTNGLHHVVSGDGRDGTVKIHQDVDIYVGNLQNSDSSFVIRKGRHLWLQMIKGHLNVQGFSEKLQPGDALMVSDETVLSLEGRAEFLLFDLN